MYLEEVSQILGMEIFLYTEEEKVSSTSVFELIYILFFLFFLFLFLTESVKVGSRQKHGHER